MTNEEIKNKLSRSIMQREKHIERLQIERDLLVQLRNEFINATQSEIPFSTEKVEEKSVVIEEKEQRK